MTTLSIIAFVVLVLLAVWSLSGCAQVRQVEWTRKVDNVPCETDKINPAWWSSETMTFCVPRGKPAVVVPSNHDDISILAGFAAISIALMGVAL